MIIVLGSINIDWITRVPRIAGPGETVVGQSCERVPGGKGANQALAARRAGAEVRLLGAVGDDGFADAALERLRDAGVDVSGVVRTALPTGAAFIGVDPQGRNAITVAVGANSAADGTAVSRIGLATRDILLLQREVPDAQGEAAARAAKAAGARVVLNLAPSGPIDAGYLSLIDVLIMNEHEAADLASGFAAGSGGHASAPQLAAALRARFGIDVVVTLGEAGAVGWSSGVEHRVPACPVTAVDTTGAGDSFAGAFTAALAEGTAFAEALRIGAIAGSIACTRHGAQAGIPTRAEIEDAIARHGHPR